MVLHLHRCIHLCMQDEYEEEMQSFLGGEDCPVFSNMYQYCQVCQESCTFAVLHSSTWVIKTKMYLRHIQPESPHFK